MNRLYVKILSTKPNCERFLCPFPYRVESGADACGVFLGEVEQAVASVASLTARKSGLQQLAAVC